MKFWLMLNSAAIFFLMGMLYLVVRQIGLMLHRLGPIGARSSDDMAPRVGENIGFYMASIRRSISSTRPILYIFASKSCSICAEVRRGAERLSSSWGKINDIVMIYDSDSKDEEIECIEIKPGLYLANRETRRQMEIGFVPFAIMVNQHDTVLGRGLINDISHVESLLELSEKVLPFRSNTSTTSIATTNS